MDLDPLKKNVLSIVPSMFWPAIAVGLVMSLTVTVRLSSAWFPAESVTISVILYMPGVSNT